jgi:hypothetical protein
VHGIFKHSTRSQKYLLEYHSVCPGCVGEAMIQKQKCRVDELVKGISTDRREAELRGGLGVLPFE